jgi:hypothetical protein
MMSSKLKFRRTLRTLLTVTGLAVVIGGAGVGSALADDGHRDRDSWRWEQHERREHAERAHEWREHRQRYYREPAPYYYDAPPPVVYAPPPALRLVFPFDFR